MVVYLSAFAIRCWETLSVTSVNWNLRPIFRSSLFLQIASAMRDSTRYLESPQISIKYWTTYYRLGLHLRQLEFIIKLSAGLLASSLDGVAARRLPASLYQACFLAIFSACRGQKNAEFLSFWLEFWVFSWVLSFFLSFEPFLIKFVVNFPKKVIYIF